MNSQGQKKWHKSFRQRVELALYNRRNHRRMEILDRVLRQASGVLHIGAHLGQESSRYEQFLLPAVFIEGNPEIFEDLRHTLSTKKEQTALLALLGREDLESRPFFVANNEGASSSFFRLSENHGFEAISLEMSEVLHLPTRRLDSIASVQQLSGLSHWVLDVQGAELEVLQGAGDLLLSCQTLQVEVSRRQIYEGGVSYSELSHWLGKKGFSSLWDPPPGFHGDHLFFRVRTT